MKFLDVSGRACLPTLLTIDQAHLRTTRHETIAREALLLFPVELTRDLFPTRPSPGRHIVQKCVRKGHWRELRSRSSGAPVASPVLGEAAQVRIGPQFSP
jgi:hypothetical protein